MKNKLYGAILGDLCGQPYEFPIMKGPYTNVEIHNPISIITDDTLMTLATASYILGRFETLEQAYKDMGKRYPGDHYGKGFKEWIDSPLGTINNSWGNGCLMRISPFMYLNENEDYVKEKIIESCQFSHNHPKSILSSLKLYDLYFEKRGELSMFYNKKHIPKFSKFKVEADITFKFIEKLSYACDSTKEMIIFAVECGGDTDTNASIIGELMNFIHNDLDQNDVDYVESKLDDYLLGILKDFNNVLP